MSLLIAAVLLIVLIIVAYVEEQRRLAERYLLPGGKYPLPSGKYPLPSEKYSDPDSFCGDLSNINAMAQTYLKDLAASFPTYAKAFAPVAQKIGIKFTEPQCEDPTESMKMWVLGAASDLGGYVGILMKDRAPAGPMNGAKALSAELAKFIGNYT